MNRYRGVKKYYEFHEIVTTEHWFFLLLKTDGTSFVPGGWVNQLPKDSKKFEEIMIRNLGFKDIKHLSTHQRTLNDSTLIKHVSEEIEAQLLNSEARELLPKDMRNVDRKPSRFEEFSEHFSNIPSRFVLGILYILYILTLFVLVTLGFAYLVYLGFNTYQYLFLALAAEDLALVRTKFGASLPEFDGYRLYCGIILQNRIKKIYIIREDAIHSSNCINLFRSGLSVIEGEKMFN